MYPSKLYSEENFQTSLNLVRRDINTNDLVLDNDALNLIRNIEGKISVCVCVGQYGSGKSFLLNNIFKYLTNSPYNLFQMGHYDHIACTLGSWINKEVPTLKIEDENNDKPYLIFIDTQVINIFD